jgi:pimeloyl-ACP methyl ester carboxylesterase
MQTIQIPGANLHVDIQGVHPTNVFVHGLGDDLSTWDTLWSELNQHQPTRRSLLRYDLRGFGQSVAFDDSPYNHADDLLALLDAAGIEQCDLIGVSMGGSIALNFTLDHPERVNNLILISPNLVGWEWSDEWRNLWEPIVTHARNGQLNEARRLWWEHPLFETTRHSPAGPALLESIMRFPGRQWINDSHRLMLPDVERLYLLETRTLLLTGGRDHPDLRLIADLIEASACNLQRCDCPELGHLLHLEDPEACSRKILEFLSSSPVSAGTS